MSSLKEEFIKHKYIKGDEFVTDGVTIMGCREEKSRDIIDNGRLGTYDNYGNYRILDSIKEELIRLPKVVTLTSASASFSGGSDEYEAKANIPIFGDIKFKLVVNNNSATFFLIEKVNREAGGYLEIYEEKLESIDLRKEALDLPFIFSYFNITNEEIDLGQKWKEINIPNILTRKVYMAALSKKIKENSNQVTEEQAFNRMVDMLKDGGEYGKTILDKLDARMQEKGEFAVFRGTNAYGKALNDILLGTIHLVNSERPELSLENKELYYTLLEIRNNTTQDILQEARNELSNADVELAVEKINQLMKSGDLDEDLIFDYPDEEGTGQLRKAILKRKVEKEAAETVSDLNEDGTPKTKEQKIKEILEGKSKAKKKPQKKVVPAKKPPSKQKLKAKGKSKKAGAKKKAKGKKKAKKPVVKKAAKGLKAGKPKKGAVVAKKKKKKNKNETDLYRRDSEFLRNLFVTPAMFQTVRESKVSSDKTNAPIVIRQFKPNEQRQPTPERRVEQQRETNIFGNATRLDRGQLQSAARLNRQPREQEGNIFNSNNRTVGYERNLNVIHSSRSTARTGITPVRESSDSEVLSEGDNIFIPEGETAIVTDGQNNDNFGFNAASREETNPFSAEPRNTEPLETQPKEDNIFAATTDPLTAETNPFASTSDDKGLSQTGMDSASIMDFYRN